MYTGFRIISGVDGQGIVIDLEFNWNPEYFESLARVWQLKKIRGVDFIRAGNPDFDGGYITINDPRANKIAYSFGINQDVSWDDDMANLGYQIFMYDMTIEDLPKHRPEFHFFKEGIGGKFDPVQKLDTLEHFIKRNGHENRRNMILKMDVEGAEYDFIEQVDSKTLEQFDQMTFEFHNLVMGLTFERAAKIISCFKKLNQTHQIVHLHANNANVSIMYEDDEYPELLEITYANRANYEFIDEEINLPIPRLDMPNIAQNPEIILGRWNDRVKKF